MISIGEAHPGGGADSQRATPRPDPIDLDQAGGDQGLGSPATVGQAALDEQISVSALKRGCRQG
jgi:hypothetical protein